jgi:flavin-dependent dehydrogenase
MDGEPYDVAIVGARVAGSTLAALLGREGFRVLLVDAGRFPSDTISTHFFRGAAFLEVLRRSGALERILALGSPPLRREYVYLEGAETPEIGPPQNPGEIGHNLSVRRLTLDAALVEHAARGGEVTFAPGTEVVGLERIDGTVCGLRLGGKDGGRRIRASLVVGADGRNSSVARAVSAPVDSTEAGHRGIYYAYYSDFPSPSGAPDGAEFSVHGDEIAYVFPSDGNLTCIALSMNLERYRWCRERPEERFLARLQDHHPGVGHRLAGSRREGRLLGAGPAPNFMRRPFGPGWALVGDSETHQDPFSGHGIDTAGLHAAILAEEIRRWRGGATDWGGAGRRYAERRDGLSRGIYEATVVASRDLSAPAPSAPAAPSVQDPDG